jgi:hypothetical protein
VHTVLAIPQGTGDSLAIAGKFDVHFVFGFDKNMVAAHTLGIVHEKSAPIGIGGDGGNDTVMPTVIIVGKEGRILWTHETDNYRMRPEPEIFSGFTGKFSLQLIKIYRLL